MGLLFPVSATMCTTEKVLGRPRPAPAQFHLGGHLCAGPGPGPRPQSCRGPAPGDTS